MVLTERDRISLLSFTDTDQIITANFLILKQFLKRKEGISGNKTKII